MDPTLKLGGPSFQGVNKDIEVWPDANGGVSWLGRFLDYLKQHGRMKDLAFFSFEHYPYDPAERHGACSTTNRNSCATSCRCGMRTACHADMPMFVTEGNLSSGASETSRIFSPVSGWRITSGRCLDAGGNGSLLTSTTCRCIWSRAATVLRGRLGCSRWMRNYKVQQPLAQFFVAQLINLEWAQPGGGEHRCMRRRADIEDGAGHELVTAYALKRPDGQWSVMLVNRDQEAAHKVRVAFRGESGREETFTGPVDVMTFGSEQYRWHPAHTRFMAHAEHAAQPTVVAFTKGWADPDGPVARSKVSASKNTSYDLPAASVVVIRGNIGQ